MERDASFLDSIEKAETPREVVGALGGLSLRRLVTGPIQFGQNLVTIVMNGDTGEMLRASANHLH